MGLCFESGTAPPCKSHFDCLQRGGGSRVPAALIRPGHRQSPAVATPAATPLSLLQSVATYVVPKNDTNVLWHVIRKVLQYHAEKNHDKNHTALLVEKKAYKNMSRIIHQKK